MEAPNLDIDSEDLGFDIIPAIEKSFRFEFTQADLADVRTYGELCAAVRAKLPEATAADCTSQQAFYKLRRALQMYAGAQNITPATKLENVLPLGRAQRRTAAAAIEHRLGMKLQLLDMPPLAATVGSVLLELSLPGTLLGGLFGGATGAFTGLAGFVTAIIVFNLGSRWGTTLRYATVREAVLEMSSAHYRQSRRDPLTVNQQEITDALNRLFVNIAGVELAELRPDAVL